MATRTNLNVACTLLTGYYAWNLILMYARIDHAIPGAHNDIRAKGKGRSMQRPPKRLKLENVPMVVLLLFLACTRMCH